MEGMGLKVFGGIFRGKRVLVTGHTGFKGSWLALWLHSLGAKVVGLSLPPDSIPSHFELIKLNSFVNHVEGDIRDFGLVKKVFKKAKPQIVFHLAAQALVRNSYVLPKETFDTNIGGTVNILEAIRKSKVVKVAVIITSDKCYKNKELKCGYSEDDPMGGYDPYSASKGAVEIVCSSYCDSFFNKIGFATVRAGNVIGGGDWAKDRLIPDCVRALSKNKPIVIRNPKSVRPWQYVLDPISGYLFLAQQLLKAPDKFSGAWNFGPSDKELVTVLELAKRFIADWGDGEIALAKPNQSTLHEIRLLRLSIEKAINKLGWFPILDSLTAINRTIDWYKTWRQGKKNLRDVSLEQIYDYTKIALEKKARWVVRA
jgi:CDP-glucose 4,6-dehydratase